MYIQLECRVDVNPLATVEGDQIFRTSAENPPCGKSPPSTSFPVLGEPNRTRYRWIISERLCNVTSIKAALEADAEVLRDAIAATEKYVEAGKRETNIRRGKQENSLLHGLTPSASLGGWLPLRQANEKYTGVASKRSGPYDALPRTCNPPIASSTVASSSHPHSRTVSFHYSSIPPCSREASRVRTQSMKTLIPSSPQRAYYGLKPAVAPSHGAYQDMISYTQRQSLTNPSGDGISLFRNTVQEASIPTRERPTVGSFASQRAAVAHSGNLPEQIARQHYSRESSYSDSMYAEPCRLRMRPELHSSGESSFPYSDTQLCLGSSIQLPPPPPRHQRLPCKVYYHSIRAIGVHYVVDEASRETQKRGDFSRELSKFDLPQEGCDEIQRHIHETSMAAQFLRLDEEGRYRRGGSDQGGRINGSCTSNVRCKLFSCKRYGRQQAEALATEFLQKISSAGTTTMSASNAHHISAPTFTDNSLLSSSPSLLGVVDEQAQIPLLEAGVDFVR